MKDKQILKDLEELRNKYTFSQDKELVKHWEKSIKKELLKQELLDRKPIKELVNNLEKKIEDITRLLAWDKELMDDTSTRKSLFVKREAYQYLVSFFKDSEKRVENMKKMVKSELKNK